MCLALDAEVKNTELIEPVLGKYAGASLVAELEGETYEI